MPVEGYNVCTRIPSNLQETSSCRVYNNMYNDTVVEEINQVLRSAITNKHVSIKVEPICVGDVFGKL